MEGKAWRPRNAPAGTCCRQVRAQKPKPEEWAKLRDDITGQMGVKTLVFPFVAEQACPQSRGAVCNPGARRQAHIGSGVE
jgi:hypothetical protein